MFSAALVEEAEEPILRKASGSSGSMPGGRRGDLVPWWERGARRAANLHVYLYHRVGTNGNLRYMSHLTSPLGV